MDAERAIRAASQSRDLCLSLRRAFVGPPALEQLRGGGAAALTGDRLAIALGLAWAEGDAESIRRALAAVPPHRVGRDAVLLTFRAAIEAAPSGDGRPARSR